MSSKRKKLHFMEDDAVEQSEEDDDEAMRLDSVMDDEGLAEVVFDFDDPQERHFESIRGLLRASAMSGVTKDDLVACDALAEIAAKDPASVGTVVTAGGDKDEVVALAAALGLQLYKVGTNAGIDAVRATLSQAAPPSAAAIVEAATTTSKRQHALIARAQFVNVPPRVLAAMYTCFAKDIQRFAADGFVIIVAGNNRTVATNKIGNASKRSTFKTQLDCDGFDDECFAAKAAEVVPIGPDRRGRTLFALHLDTIAFTAAVNEIHRLAQL